MRIKGIMKISYFKSQILEKSKDISNFKLFISNWELQKIPEYLLHLC